MVAGNACNTYLNSHYDGMEPEQLILMLYDGAIKFTRLAREGFNEKNIKKRGENIGKVIAIISELNSSLDPSVQDEAIDFLRNLYAKMLIELPKVSLNNDIRILDLTESYLTRLRDIWANDVMGKAKKQQAGDAKVHAVKKAPVTKPIGKKQGPLRNTTYAGNNTYGQKQPNIPGKSIRSVSA